MTDTTRTLSEIRATCTKAARGAGCAWGVAEEAGLAARVLESHGLPGLGVLARLFGTERNCGTANDARATCGLRAMVTLSDRLPFTEDAVPEGAVAGPLLLAAPLILAARESGTSFTLAWEGAVLHCMPEGVVAQGALDRAVAERVTVTPAPGGAGQGAGPDWRSRAVDHGDWTRLEALAARTLVPETEASRAAGAGPADTGATVAGD